MSGDGTLKPVLITEFNTSGYDDTADADKYHYLYPHFCFFSVNTFIIIRNKIAFNPNVTLPPGQGFQKLEYEHATERIPRPRREW